jgi:DNA-directed RNA polymerase specialized sigma24 family protein
VLHSYLGLPAERAAEVMSISTGAARSHLARGMSSLRHRPE